MAKVDLTGKLAVILHADVADSTALVRQNEQLAERGGVVIQPTILQKS